ncbi:MAG: energy-coupling factor transporter transmembrane protein EcfT [Candidatus Abyssobacteria bacterium SURF_5]|uniref:Energy-coupling factor transporter transmembrane protein EcfT n=1 Tax=Abyssobacteria bacterium (strain SURF_5) TaxID=2093360 RepID=A0A3A4NEN0_ABYX5|nr:MAG: energy-coupling factor transporter transmembrane protein EcfT [Candidatus Abyssubacteria bacterium SURF_5]
MTLFSMAAFAAREPWTLSVLLVLNFSLYLLSRMKLVDLWRDIRFFLVQAVIVVILYFLRFGAEGLYPGLRVSMQIFLFFMPGAIFLRTTNSLQLIRSLRRFLSPRFSFVVLCSFRFIPVFFREFQEIAMAQRLRGAPLSPRKMLNPRNWKYAADCLFIPLIVRALRTADEAALSAEARGMRSGADPSFHQQYLFVTPPGQAVQTVPRHPAMRCKGVNNECSYCD